MGDFFKGWRRKMGVMTLVMALVFMAGWVRSLTCYDAVGYRWSNVEQVDFISFQSVLYLWNQYPSATSTTLRIASNRTYPIHWYSYRLPKDGLVLSSANLQWNWRYFGFGICENQTTEDQMQSLAIPYWSIVLPLTLLSAYLLLGKPRVAKPKIESGSARMAQNRERP